jgi:hypothetical protein
MPVFMNSRYAFVEGVLAIFLIVVDSLFTDSGICWITGEARLGKKGAAPYHCSASLCKSIYLKF